MRLEANIADTRTAANELSRTSSRATARRGHPLARGLDAVVGNLRTADAGVPGQSSPPSVTARVAAEQASTFGWERYVGSAGRVIGMKTFGAFAQLKALQQKFGFEPDRVATAAKALLGKP